MTTIQIHSSLYVQSCCNCGIQFAVPSDFDVRRREDHARFYCPAGHSQSYTGEREADKLRRERDRLAQRVAERDDEIKRQRELREGADRRAAAARGQVTKMKNRVGRGVCPCCNRSFANLHRHMTTEHPTFAAEAAE